MKKVIALLLAVVLVFALAACGSTSGTSGSCRKLTVWKA